MITDAHINRLLILSVAVVLALGLFGKWRKNLRLPSISLVMGGVFTLAALYHFAQWALGSPEGSRFLGPQSFASGGTAIYFGFLAILQFNNHFHLLKDRVLWGRPQDPSWFEFGTFCLLAAAMNGYLAMAEPEMDRAIRLSFQILGVLSLALCVTFYAISARNRFTKGKAA